MNLIQIQRKYNTKQKCLDYLVKLRWGKTVSCTFCDSDNVTPLKNEAGRFHCNKCKKNFSVLTGTIFEDSRLPMTKWFMVIGLITNAKKGMSAKEIRRNIGLTYKTAWYSAMRIRCGMVNNCKVLQNLVEMDEAYIGGKPRQSYTARDNEPNLSQVTNKRGRGTNKVPIVGIVERDGDIVLKVIEKLTSKNLLAMLKENVKTTNAVVITDEYKSYKKFDEIVEHLTVNHSKKQYVKGVAHTNTLEGFFSILKNSIKGNYIAISKKYLPFYLVHAGYIYNHRNFTGNLFEVCLQDMVTHKKPMEHYKPVKPVNEIVYKQCKK